MLPAEWDEMVAPGIRTAGFCLPAASQIVLSANGAPGNCGAIGAACRNVFRLFSGNGCEKSCCMLKRRAKTARRRIS
jgi:hypothetical protein